MVTNYLTNDDSFVPVDAPRDNIMENLKFTVNEYVGKSLKKLSSQKGFYFQCQLCPHRSAEKKEVLHHFLTNQITLSQPGGHIVPTTLLHAPRIFRP